MKGIYRNCLLFRACLKNFYHKGMLYGSAVKNLTELGRELSLFPQGLCKPGQSPVFSFLRRFFQSLALYFLITGAVTPLELEIPVALSWGKRFVDTFDRRWPGLRANSLDFAPAQYEKLETMRDLPGAQVLVAFSPFYRHYFGVGFSWFTTTGNVSQQYTVNNQIHFWDLAFTGYAPLVHYRYYPGGNQTDLYFSASAGLVMATMKLNYRSSTVSAQSATLDRIRGPSVEAAIGYVFQNFGRTGLFAELALQTQRLDPLEGYYQQPNGTTQHFKLKHNKSYMVPVTPAEENLFSGFSNTVLWNTQLRVALGIIFRLGQ